MADNEKIEMEDNEKVLKVVSTTFEPITMYKQQPLSFHVVPKTFITQNHLVFNSIPGTILRFFVSTAPVLHVLHIFNPEITEANILLKKNIIAGYYTDDVCQCLKHR